ncbi:leukotriene C4 synthase isoform X4 [Symphalangus syndactylus]|uniref:leukotriene C4 synthase isoform X4 n=1 Tax=Symphalangus syndactylus TaxID=9590 RepID=UPI0024428F2C|nr:leukotriene C4 synthase isoform X3 [Symphalangus syndactylus]
MVTPPRTPSTEMGREEHRGCSSSTGPTSEQQTGLSVPQLAFTHSLCHRANGTMKDEVALLATVTLLGVLLQAYFSLQVISARRAFRVSPPLTTGPPEFERVYRAQVNCSEYFPLFLATLWVAGIFFHEGRSVGQGHTRWTPGARAARSPGLRVPLAGAAALCGLVYLFARLRYFQGYARSAQLRLAPLYASARALWLLVALAALGLLAHFLPAALRAALLGRLRTLLPWA